MRLLIRILFLSVLSISCLQAIGQHSVAHQWTEVNLNSIRSDFARPPQTARSLWHLSIGMYDAWAAYDSISVPYFLGHGMGSVPCAYDGLPPLPDTLTVTEAQELAISYAAYHIIKTRYDYNNAVIPTTYNLDTMMAGLGLDPNFTSTDYSTGDPRALGNYIASQLMSAALQDGSNEGTGDINGYLNQYYEPVNDPLDIQLPDSVGNANIDSLNRYQPISFLLFCDQTEGTFLNTTPQFIGAEWGEVVPFSLKEEDKEIKTRDGQDWVVYHDPGPQPRIDDISSEESQIFQWNMDLVLKWSQHLSMDDPTVWDVSPASIGNLDINDFPDDFADYDQFYNFEDGGDPGQGYALNPSTGLPYEPQLVKRGDYARILAEFWADGPNSETPPGHWFRIYNEIKYHPDFTWKWRGQGEPLSHLEHDIRTYFTIGGTMHDAAIASWSIKGYYDAVRPVSIIRAMAELGQRSDPNLPNYDPTGKGLPLVPGWIELIMPGDTMAGPNDEWLYELKVQCWLGPLDEDTCIAGDAPVYHSETAGVGWKLALDWWPYQRPTFVTPAFAGYTSGHSTFSRAAAETMTMITGDPFFPGGMAEFHAPQDDFLVFENGPSTDIILQWATYQDASDQCSLSRIWGGIHPPFDDIPGRKIGYEIGHEAFDLAETYFLGGIPLVTNMTISDEVITDADLPNPLTIEIEYSMAMDTLTAPTVTFVPDLGANISLDSYDWTSETTATLTYDVLDNNVRIDDITVTSNQTTSRYGVMQEDYTYPNPLVWDTENPVITDLVLNPTTVDGSTIGTGTFTVTAQFSEAMGQSQIPALTFPLEDPSNSVVFNSGLSDWPTADSYQFAYDVIEVYTVIDGVDIEIGAFSDFLGNPGVPTEFPDAFDLSVVTSIPEVSLDGSLKIYPNPISAGENLKLRSEGSHHDVHVTIYDSMGRLVMNHFLADLDRKIVEIPTHELNAGSYRIYLKGSDVVLSLQMVIIAP